MTTSRDDSIHKQGGALIYLVEEVGDARLRCEQLKRYVAQAHKLIDASPNRDQIYEVAGNLIFGIPETLFKLDKALDAVALASSRLDYEELKLSLTPEKVDELEEVLQDVRLRSVQRRSNPAKQATMNLPSKERISSALNRIATSLSEGATPSDVRARAHRVLMAMSRTAEEAVEAMGPIQAGSREEVMKGFKSANPALTDAQLEEIADQWEANKDKIKDKHASAAGPLFSIPKPSRIASELGFLADTLESYGPKEASVKLRRVLMALSQTAGQAIEAMGPIQAGSREDVMKGFKEANPALTDAQLEEIADQWEANKNVVKEKHAGSHFDSMVTNKEHLPKALSSRYVQGLKVAMGRSAQIKVVKSETSATRGWDYTNYTILEITAAKGSVPVRAAITLNVANEDGGSQFCSGIAVLDAPYGAMPVPRNTPDRVIVHLITEIADALKVWKIARYEEGKPADPTENMSAEDTAEWKKQNDEHKDKFKSAVKQAMFQVVAQDRWLPKETQVWYEYRTGDFFYCTEILKNGAMSGYYVRTSPSHKSKATKYSTGPLFENAQRLMEKVKASDVFEDVRKAVQEKGEAKA